MIINVKVTISTMKNKDILYPLRRIHGAVNNVYERIKKEFALVVYITFPLGKKILIPGTPEHQNLGDSAIVIAQKEFLKKCGIPDNRIKEVSFSEYKLYRKLLVRFVNKNLLITQVGGGNMGNQWIEEEQLHRDLLTDFPNNSQIIFPQTVFYTSTDFGEQEKQKSVKYYNGREKITLFARENKSYEIMKALYPETSVLLVPDIVLSTTQDVFGVQKQKRDKILLCLRNDVEKAMTADSNAQIEHYLKVHEFSYRITDMYSIGYVSKNNRYDCIRRKMEEFASARLVITDRLHGMVFSAITGTPCIVFGNYNYKVEGTYEWIKYLKYIRFVKSVDEMEKVFSQLYFMERCEYNNSPLRSKFEILAKIVKEYWTDY